MGIGTSPFPTAGRILQTDPVARVISEILAIGLTHAYMPTASSIVESPYEQRANVQ